VKSHQRQDGGYLGRAKARRVLCRTTPSPAQPHRMRGEWFQLCESEIEEIRHAYS